MKKGLSLIIGFLFSMTFSLCILATALYGMGTIPAVMQSQMERFAPSEATGLPEAEYTGMARMITRYLSGEEEEFQYIIDYPDGNHMLVFHDYEQQHMADCRKLFELARILMILSFGISVVLLTLMLFFQKRKTAAMGCFSGACFLIVGISIIVIWGMMDFSSLFITFHHLAFDNTLWLLNPATDMLIRLMPTAFFMDAVMKVALIWIISICVMLIASALLMRKGNRK